MGKTPTTTPTSKQPKTVALSTYVQSLVIAVLVTGIACFIASYFFTTSLHSQARAAVVNDMTIVSKDRQ